MSGGYRAESHQRYASLVRELDEIRERIQQALEAVAEAEIFALSKRFPTRRIAFDSGMGVSQITIDRRHPDYNNTYDRWKYSDSCHEGVDNWPDWLEIPAPELWAALRVYEDEVSDKEADPALGCIIYENGVRLKGLGEPWRE